MEALVRVISSFIDCLKWSKDFYVRNLFATGIDQIKCNCLWLCAIGACSLFNVQSTHHRDSTTQNSATKHKNRYYMDWLQEPMQTWAPDPSISCDALNFFYANYLYFWCCFLPSLPRNIIKFPRSPRIFAYCTSPPLSLWTLFDQSLCSCQFFQWPHCSVLSANSLPHSPFPCIEISPHPFSCSPCTGLDWSQCNYVG